MVISHASTSPPEPARELVRSILDPESVADPYPVMNRIRDAEPVWMSDQVVVLASHEACSDVLRSSNASTDRSHSALFRPASGAPVRELTSFLFLDPPHHTRLRRLVSKSFTPRLVRRLDPIIRELVDDLIDGAARRGRFEAVADLAYPLPVAVICRVLGVPPGDEAWFRARSSILSRALDPHLALLGVQPPGLDRRRVAEKELNEYFVDLAARRRADLGDDLLSELITAEVDGDRLTPGEISTTCRFLLNAGHETTVNLIGNGILALVRAPSHLAAMTSPAYAAQVVEEVLRLDPPLQLVHRYAAADLDVAGTRVPKGTTLLLLLAAANRDPELRTAPEAFEPATESGHLAFGQGIHFCLGAFLARLEGRLALTRFAQRVADPRGGSPAYRENVSMRGLASLDIQISHFQPRSLAWPTD